MDFEFNSEEKHILENIRQATADYQDIDNTLEEAPVERIQSAFSSLRKDLAESGYSALGLTDDRLTLASAAMTVLAESAQSLFIPAEMSLRVFGRIIKQYGTAEARERILPEIVSGSAVSLSRSTSRDLEMSQFWQNRQPRLQPAVPNDSTLVPG